MPDRVRLTVPSDERSLVLAGALARHYGHVLGMTPEETDSLAGSVVDLVRFTLEHAYPGEPDGDIELTLDLVGRSVQVDVHDWGRPLTSADEASGLPPDLRAIVHEADDLRLINLGADGKRLILTRRVSSTVHAEPESHDFDSPGRRAAAAPSDARDEVEIRDGAPDDAEAISQLLYENYHLTYGHPDFYRPRWVSERLETGALLSTVAVHDGQVIGHHAALPVPGTASAETGVAVVHPAYRGLGIFNRVFDHTIARAEAGGLDAVWGRAVTVHPYSQRAERSHGYRETALLLASVPAQMAMAGALATTPGRRTASLVTYRVLRRSARAVSLPSRYADLLRATYENSGLELAEPVGDPPEDEAVAAEEDESRATGYITVRARDPEGFARVLRHHLARHVDVVYADLDLHRGIATDEAVARLNELGFFYAGLVLHGPDGHDFLRLQRMNAENVELEQIVCDSDFAGALLAAVLADREQVGG